MIKAGETVKENQTRVSTMKAGVYLGGQQIRIEERKVPALKEGEVLLKVSHIGICGTDMAIYHGNLSHRVKPPLVMGHEMSGVVVENGDTPFQIGERVVVEPTLNCGKCKPCRSGNYNVCKNVGFIGIERDGGFAEYVAVPYERLHRIPTELSDAHAAVVEPLAVAVHAVKMSNLKLGDDVVIFGAGPIGLLVGLAAKEAGAGRIIVSDISPFRLKKAEELGFIAIDSKNKDAVAEVRALTDQNGADIVFEVAGIPITAKQMVEAVKIQGQIVVVSLFKQPSPVDLQRMQSQEISLITCRCYVADDFEKTIQLMSAGRIDVSPIISHVLSLDHIAEGFSLMENPEKSIKILIKP